jgi:two-component system LytT family sensor kinase
MKLVKPKSIEWKCYFALMPIIAAATCFVFFGSGWYVKTSIWVYAFGMIMCSGLLMWYLDVMATRQIHNIFCEYKDTLKRIGTLLIKQILILSLHVILIILCLKEMPVEDFVVDGSKFWAAESIGVGLTLIATIIWEGDYIFQQWKESLAEKEKYGQLGLQGEFDTLKSQVNPHFLFNCFNTLSSLITEDKQKAEKFLNELSKVYRYLLRNNEDGMSTLKSEVQFIKSYFQLLQTRHGEAVEMQIEIDKRYDNYMLPSLSLQMLVENAVKHNSLSKNYPLTIEIFTTVGNKLVVNNNIQVRAKKAPSGKVGLTNIRSKYELLGQQGFQIMEDGKNYTVVLPLLWGNTPGNSFKSPPSF